jgi:membrane protein
MSKARLDLHEIHRPAEEQGTGGIWSVLRRAGASWMADNAMRLSAALALYAILSLAPLLVITFKVVGFIWRTEGAARKQIMQQMSELMGSQAAEAIEPMLRSAAHRNGTLATIVSTVILFFSATGVFVELQDAMNIIWGVKSAPNRGLYAFIRARLLSLGMVFGIAFLLLISMFLTAVLTTIGRWVLGDAGWFAVCVDVVAILIVVWVLFSAIFKFLPDVKLTWRHVALGGLVTAVLFTIGKYGLAVYFKIATPTSAFGAAGSLAAVMLWVYYSAFILFFGAEFTKEWTLEHDHRIQIEPFAVPAKAEA